MMKKPAFFGRRKLLKPSWSYSVSGTLWRLLVSPGGHLIGEVRDQDQKTASFFCADGESGNRLWENVALDEPWWVGVEEVLHDHVVLHGYDKPDMPMHRGIWVLGLNDGTVRWLDTELEYWFSRQETVYAVRRHAEGKTVVALDLRSGRILSEQLPDAPGLEELRRSAAEWQRRSDLSFPSALPETAEQFSRHRSRFEGGLPLVLPEALHDGDQLLLAYHVARAGRRGLASMQAKFAILDESSGEVRYRDTLCRSVDAPATGQFFVRAHIAYYVKDHNTLVAVRVR